jgi:hypothetical protein
MPPELFGSQYPVSKIFTKAAFVAPPPGTQGNFGRNALRGFGATQADVAFQRRFALTEQPACASVPSSSTSSTTRTSAAPPTPYALLGCDTNRESKMASRLHSFSEFSKNLFSQRISALFCSLFVVLVPFLELAFRLQPVVQVAAVNSTALDVDLKRSLTDFL